MSISLNDHENRIKALELESKTPFTQTMLFNGNSNQRTIMISDDVRKYNAVLIHYYTAATSNQMIGYSVIIPSILYNTNLGCPFSNGKTQALIKVHENKFYFVENYQNLEHLKYVVGLKWGGGINFGTLLKRFLVYIKPYSDLFHFHLSEEK